MKVKLFFAGVLLVTGALGQIPREISRQVRELTPWNMAEADRLISRLRGLAKPIRELALRRLARSDCPYYDLRRNVILYKQFGNSGRQGRQVEAIRRALLLARDDEFRADMAHAISWIREGRLQRVVRSWLQPAMDPNLRRESLTYLQMTEDGPTRKTIKALLPGTMTPGGRLLCLAYLVLAGESDYTERLAKVIRTGGIDRHDFFRFQGWIQRAPALNKEILGALADLLAKTKEGDNQYQILRIFQRFNHPPAFLVVRKFMENPSYRLAQQAFLTVASFPGETRLVQLRKMLDHKLPDRRLIAADLLRKLDDNSGFPTVVTLFKKGAGSRQETLMVMGKFRLRLVIPLLIQGLLAKEKRIRYLSHHYLGLRLRDLFPYRHVDLASTGYEVKGNPTDQLAAVAKLQRWWQTHGGK